jgi:hypothetical protein
MKIKTYLFNYFLRQIKFMKLTKIAAFLLVIFSAVGLISCLEGGNRTDYWGIPAVVKLDSKMGHALYIGFGNQVAIPTSSIPIGITAGDNVIVSFTINYDDQPTTQYYTATNVVFHGNTFIDATNAYTISGENRWSDYYTDTITGVAYATANMGWNVDERLFLALGGMATSKDEFEYEMFCNVDSVDSGGAQTFYIRAKKNEYGTGTVDKQVYAHVFDMSDYVYRLGRDTTINGTEIIYLRFNLKYQSGIDIENKKSIYKAYEYNPLLLFVKVKS